MGPYIFYGSLWILMVLNVSLLVLTHPYGSLWFLMCPYASIWILMGSYAFFGP